jgi:undecaprenyl diphosphate synthase
MAERKTPDHIAIIMDGNRRWASERGKSGYSGHHQGAGIVEDIAETVHDHGVKWLTLFAFSTENWKRSSVEITAIMTVFRHFLITRIDRLVEKNIHLRVIGDLDRFAPDIIENLNIACDRTASNDGLNLTIALGYGGKADMAQAARQIAQKVASGQVQPDDVDETLMKQHLGTADLPDVDLLIRTGREKRVSNFLLWDMAYAELAFSETLWPDFDTHEMARLIDDYCHRDRRFGGDANSLGLTKRFSGQS